MAMYVQTTLTLCKFPMYVLSEEPELVDGLVWINDQVVDDRNMLGKTIGHRRLQTPMKSLYPLHRQINEPSNVYKHRGKHFIDTEGTYYYKELKPIGAIKYHKIASIKEKQGIRIIRCHDLAITLKTLTPQPTNAKWCGVLYVKNMPWTLWEYSETKKKNRKRNV